MFEQKLEWRHFKNSLITSELITTKFNSKPTIISYKRILSNEQLIKYDVTLEESNISENYEISMTKSYELTGIEKK